MLKKYFSILFLFFLASCATFSGGYAPKKNFDDTNIVVDKDKKKNLTFSISYYSQVGNEETEKFYNKMMSSIREHFAKSNLFRRVQMVPFEQKSNYHYHFDMKLTGTSPSQQLATGLISGYTATLIPVSMYFYVDTTMFLYVNGKEVYSITSPELIRDTYWLPFIFLSPFCNHNTVGYSLINNNMEYFITTIAENKLY